MATSSNFIQIKNYRLDFPNIGKGAFGIVYRGRDNDTGETIAAKNVQYKEQTETLNEDNEELFIRNKKEGEILHKLNGHKNIVKLIDFFDADSCHWFIMEFCELGDLPKYMKTQAVNLHDKIKIMVDVSSGLSFMHSMRPPVIHRDIKPENVLMKLEDGEHRAKLSDFGLGKLFAADTSHFTMMSGVGTWGFMAPEFFIDTGYVQYQPGVDTFAIGLLFSVVLLYDKQKHSGMTPISVESRKSGMYIHYGLEMKNAKKNKASVPQLFEQSFEVDQCVRQLQEIITHMTQFHERDRPGLLQVKTQIMELYHEIVKENYHTTQGELKQLQTDQRQLKTDFHSAQSELKQVQTDRSQLQTDFHSVQSELKQLQTDYSQLQTAYNAVQGDWEKLCTEHKQLQAENRELQHRKREETNQQEPDMKQNSLQQQKSNKPPTAVVMFPYEAEDINELSVKKGDVVDILQEETEYKGWWKVRLLAKEGLVPHNYIKTNIIQQKPDINPKPVKNVNLVSPPSPSQQKQPEKLAPAEVMSVKHVKQGDVKAKDRVQGKVRFQAKEGVVPHNYVTVTNQQPSDIQQKPPSESLSKLDDIYIMVAANDSYVLVAAIQWERELCGYAFSYKSDKNKIIMNKNWGAPSGFESYKTPTSLMVDTANRFMAFGYEAENMYSQQTEAKDGDNYQLYLHFSRILYDNQKITKDHTLSSVNGKMTSALEIFVMALRYLKDHLIDTISQQTTSDVPASFIRWVITVPSMSTKETKDFMREAAYKAGLTQNKASQQLLIVTEPEAAYVYCRSLDVNQFIQMSGEQSLPSFRAGTKYLVINAGGEIDFTGHEIFPSGKIKEIYASIGGTWGGNKVDENFVTFMEKFLGRHFIQACQQQCPSDWQYTINCFQKGKMIVKPDGDTRVSLQLTWSIGVKYMEICGNIKEDAINQSTKSGVLFCNGSLVFSNEVVVSLFQPVIDSIVSHIDDILSESAMRGVSCLMLVGEFAQSAFLKKAIIDRYKSRVRVLAPVEAQYSVIQGAVLYGHTPNHI